MSDLLVSVSGVRGIVGDSFTEELVRSWAQAFAQFCLPGGGRLRRPTEGPRDASPSAQHDRAVVLGRDTRFSGKWALAAAAEELFAGGVTPIIADVAPTPTTQLAVTHHRAAGAIIITASHNPTEWNGLKFLGSDGVFLSAEEMEKLHTAVIASAAKQSPGIPDEIASPLEKFGARNDNQAIDRHIENVLALPIDVERIRARNFRVVVDPVNGTGALAVPPVLEHLGCQATVINGEPDGKFAHPPEPTPANLTELGERVRSVHADLGFAVDPDADRLVLVDETGTVLSEEYTVTLATLAVLSSPVVLSGAKDLTHRDPSPTAQDDKHVVAVNLSTTRMVDDVAAQWDATVIRTPVGERHVVEGMRQHGAVVGGEGNGGVIFPKSHEGRDSLVGTALVLDLLAREQCALSALVASLPHYVMTKEKLPRSSDWNLSAIATQLAGLLPDATLSTLDGVRADTPDGWVHLRPSNTEPVVRLIAEARGAQTVEHFRASVRASMAIQTSA